MRNPLHNFSAVLNLISAPFSTSIIVFRVTPDNIANRYMDSFCFLRSFLMIVAKHIYPTAFFVVYLHKPKLNSVILASPLGVVGGGLMFLGQFLITPCSYLQNTVSSRATFAG